MTKMYVRGLDRVTAEGYVNIHPIDALRRLAARRVDLKETRESYSESLRMRWEPQMRQGFWIFKPYWTDTKAPIEYYIQKYIDKKCPGTLSTTPKDVDRSYMKYIEALRGLEDLFTTVQKAGNPSLTITSKLFMFLYAEKFIFDLSGYTPLHV